MRLTERLDEHYIARQDRVNGKIIGNQMCLDMLGELEDAEEQGLLLRLPCKVGDKVYKIWSCGKHGKSVAEFEIKHIYIGGLQEIEFSFMSTGNRWSDYRLCKISDFGKTVFATREEAEAALAEKGGAE